MKRAFPGTLVLCLASLVSAGLSMDPLGIKTAVISVDSPSATQFYVSIPTEVDYTIELIPPVGSLSEISDPEVYDGLEWRFISIAYLIGDEPTAGPKVLITLLGDARFSLEGPFDGALGLYDEGMALVSLTSIIIPEPVTLALLAAGGALIRRRKR